MDILDGLRRWWARRNAASTPEREPTDPSPIPKWQERLNEWMHRVHFPPITFRAELWRDPKDNPDLPALAAKYGDDQAEGEVQFLQSHLLREVVMAAVGLLHTLEKIETLMAELQAFADEHRRV
jgi:hypothetical protein